MYFSRKKKVNPAKSTAGKKSTPDEGWSDNKSTGASTSQTELLGNQQNVDVESGQAKPDLGRANEIRRSKSRVRSYLKKCKERLTGQQHTVEEPCLQDCCQEVLPGAGNAAEGGTATSSWYVEEAEPPDISPPTDTGGGMEDFGTLSCGDSEEIAKSSEETLLDNPTKLDYRCASSETLTEGHIDRIEGVTVDSGIEELVDRYLANVYPYYHQHTRIVLVRQARDVLVCTYHGCLQSFEENFLAPVTDKLKSFKEQHKNGQRTIWCKGWPLATENGSVVLHLGAIDESYVRPQDIYLCFRPVLNNEPELCAVWRQPTNSAVIYRVIDSEKESLSPLAIEMLADELPQLLQNLLVGVERAIGRIPLNELAFPAGEKSNDFHNGYNGNSSTMGAGGSNNGTAAGATSAGGGGGFGSGIEHTYTSNGSDSRNDKMTSMSPAVVNSPKCALRRSDLITKSKAMNNKYILRRFSSKYDSINSTQCESASNDVKPVPVSNLPVFCLGNSFPHIDSDEENPEERKTSSPDNQLPHEIVAPRSITELPEKLLTSGICIPGTRDLKGKPIITIDASKVIESGLNCYEVATVLLYYSTIPERTSSFTILLIVSNNSDLTTVELVGSSLKLLTGHFQCDDLLVVCLQKHLLMHGTAASTAAGVTMTGSVASDAKYHQQQIKYLYGDRIFGHVSMSNTPMKCGGLHHHDQTKWREILATIDPFQIQCLATGQRLVAAMGDVRSSDLQGLPSRRQLYSQHRALSRALMDSELHYLRKRGAATIGRLQELAKNLNNKSNTKLQTATTPHQGGEPTSMTSVEPFENQDVTNRLNKVVVLFNELDRAAKRLEQLTEQRRERLRELTRQRALEDEMNEVTSWIQSDGDETLERFANVQLECEDAIKDYEQEFEKYYFISMKHLAKGRDLHDAASELDTLKENATCLKDNLQKFSERLENAREKIEGAARLHHLLGLHLKEDDVQQEMQKLAEKIGVPGLIEKCRSQNVDTNAKQGKQNRILATSTPEKFKTSTEGLCHCWREDSTPDQEFPCEKADQHEEDEEEHSKIADSGLGGCDRCEGNAKLTRVCSCQSFDDPGNLYDKSHNSDELEEDCFETNTKQFLDAQSPIEANSHLQCHASNLELPLMEDGGGLDPKTQKTLLLIMREMIGTERDYVRSLYYVIENYVDELLRDDIPQPLRGQRNVIFGNIEKIFEFHQPHFLAELERYENNPLKVGAAFLENESKFYLYALYNKNKPKSDTLMSEYGTTFFKSKQLELNDKMDLASYLLKPVQRMGKYALLLQQLVKACSNVQGPALQEIAADVEELQRAEEMVKFQLRHGNDLLAMDSLRDCDVNVKEQGRLLRQNEFLVWQGRGGKKSLRQVFLFEDLVLFSKARRFPDHKNLDIYIYKHSIKTSDIGLTAHIGDSPTKFEIWFRKRKPEDTWTLQSMSEEIKNAWADEVSKLLWKQAKRNREIRLAEMSSMGIGNKPCLDIRPSHNQISDRSITFSQLGKTPKFRNSFAGTVTESKSSRRPNSLISVSSMSSGTSSSSLSTGTGSTNGSNSRTGGGLELINEATTLGVSGSGKKHQRSTTLVSQLSMESGIIADISMTPDGDIQEPNWPTNYRKTSNPTNTLTAPIESKAKQPTNSELNLAEQDPYINDSITVHL